jgi:hypothetical protein
VAPLKYTKPTRNIFTIVYLFAIFHVRAKSTWKSLCLSAWYFVCRPSAIFNHLFYELSLMLSCDVDAFPYYTFLHYGTLSSEK